MSRTRETLERIGDRYPFPENAYELVLRRRSRRRMNQRIGAGLVVLVIMIASLGAAVRIFSAETQPASTPSPSISSGPRVSTSTFCRSLLRLGDAMQALPARPEAIVAAYPEGIASAAQDVKSRLHVVERAEITRGGQKPYGDQVHALEGALRLVPSPYGAHSTGIALRHVRTTWTDLEGAAAGECGPFSLNTG